MPHRRGRHRVEKMPPKSIHNHVFLAGTRRNDPHSKQAEYCEAHMRPDPSPSQVHKFAYYTRECGEIFTCARRSEPKSRARSALLRCLKAESYHGQSQSCPRIQLAAPAKKCPLIRHRLHACSPDVHAVASARGQRAQKRNLGSKRRTLPEIFGKNKE